MNTYEFKLKNEGRSGSIICYKNNNILHVYFELSGTDKYELLIDLNIKFWEKPENKPIDLEEQLNILGNLRTWLSNKNIKSSIDLPIDVREDTEDCIWQNCKNKRLVGIANCLWHYNLSILGMDQLF